MSEQKIKVTAAVLTALLFISLIFVGLTMKKNSTLKGQVDSERLKTENVLAEKLSLDKQILEFKKDLSSLTGKNAELNKYVSEMQSRIAEKEASIKKLGNENTSLRKFKKEAEDLRKMREQMQSQVAQLTEKNNAMENEIKSLNHTIAGLQQQNQGLNSQINQLQAYNGTNFKVEVVRRNPEKLTHKARRTHTVMVTFDIPKKEDKRNFRFDLQSPAGTTLPGELKVEAIAAKNELSASIGGGAAVAKEQVTLSFTPDSKLTGGTYTIFIFDGHNYINNLQFRLSK